VGLHSVRSLAPGQRSDLGGDIYGFDAAVDGADLSTTGPHGLPQHPGVMPGWDNSPRRGSQAYVFHGGNPLSFRRWLSRAAAAAGPAGRMVFVNAWNEWAEGAHLEPDTRFGCGNLEAVLDVFGPRAAVSTTDPAAGRRRPAQPASGEPDDSARSEEILVVKGAWR
jgi:hypothetical protein